MTVAQIRESFEITNAQREKLWENGYALLRGVADPSELRVHRKVINEVVLRLSAENRALEERDTYGKAFVQITNLWEKDERVKQFVFEKKFAQIAADLLGVERVRLYHDQALFKEPDGGHTPWHQDKYYWPLGTDKMITMWMPLVDIDEEMGIITFASGSHRFGLIDDVSISDESEDIYDRYVHEKQFRVERPAKMKAGDATFHLGWTIHSAGPNRSSDKMREVMTVIYFADGAKISQPLNGHQQADLDAWFPGKMPGDNADSYLNPIMN